MILIDEFKQRRRDIQMRLAPDAIAVIPGAVEQIRNQDVHYPFRQYSDFLYLTGFSEPEAVLVLTGGSSGQAILFCQPFSVEKEIWTGPLVGPEQALQDLAMDEAWSIAELLPRLTELMQGRHAIYYPFLSAGAWEKTLFQAWKMSRDKKRENQGIQTQFVDLAPMIAELRLYKSPAELQCMQRAIDVSVDAHLAVMQMISRCEYEYQALAIFQEHLLSRGVIEQAYPAIVASGPNTCILHYTQYQRRFQQGELLLLDAGAEWQGYAADITRTYPIHGEWTAEQQRIYDLVLYAQMQAIAHIRPGVVWTEIQRRVVEIITQGLVDLKILKGNVQGLIEQQAYQQFYMHSSGHWLGLDVHDVGSYQVQHQARPLEAGMVLTVEPGVYISNRLSQVDRRWMGMGIRIEDDVLVTEQGSHVLSARLPKQIDEIRAVMAYV